MFTDYDPELNEDLTKFRNNNAMWRLRLIDSSLLTAFAGGIVPAAISWLFGLNLWWILGSYTICGNATLVIFKYAFGDSVSKNAAIDYGSLTS